MNKCEHPYSTYMQKIKQVIGKFELLSDRKLKKFPGSKINVHLKIEVKPVHKRDYSVDKIQEAFLNT